MAGKPEKKKAAISLFDELKELDKQGRPPKGLFYRLTPEQQQQCDEIAKAYLAGEFDSIGAEAICKHISARFGIAMTRGKFVTILARHSGVKAR